jgi:hypothetical protein
MSYDLELGRLNPAEPLGASALANCLCGNTLALTSIGLKRRQLWRLLHWAQHEMKEKGLSQGELLIQVRWEIRRQVLAEAASPTV